MFSARKKLYLNTMKAAALWLTSLSHAEKASDAVHHDEEILIGDLSLSIGEGAIQFKTYLSICESIWAGMLGENNPSISPLAQKIAAEKK